MPKLWTRRQLYLPTLAGCALLLLLGALIATLFVRTGYGWLAERDAIGRGAMVVEGWVSKRVLESALEIYQRGQHERLIVTGGPIQGYRPSGLSSFAEVAGHFFAARGIREPELVIVPAPHSAQNRTYLSAVMVRRWRDEHAPTLRTFDIVTGGAHARRSRDLYEKAFGANDRFGVLSIDPTGHERKHWWRSTNGIREVLLQGSEWLRIRCCFWPPPQGSHEELWAMPSPDAAEPG